jgi:hypothetical protein
MEGAMAEGVATAVAAINPAGTPSLIQRKRRLLDPF